MIEFVGAENGSGIVECVVVVGRSSVVWVVTMLKELGLAKSKVPMVGLLL
jgi:hypothetical protein